MESSKAVIEDDENQLVLRDLVEKLRSRTGIVPFIGAGMSVPLGFPGWTDLLLRSAEKFGVDEKIKQQVEAGQFEEAAEVLEDALGERRFHDLIRESFGEHRLKEGRIDAPIALLPSIAAGPVVTTNFDRVLERVFAEAGRPFESGRIVKGAEVDTIGKALDLSLHVLLKVHGDFEDRTHRTLTYREYERNYRNVRKRTGYLLAEQLELMAIHSTFLFLGCSLEQDRLMDLLARLTKTYPSKVHYALVQRPADSGTFGKRVKFLSQRGIRPIWYPEGQFDNIPALLRYLSEQLTSQPTSKIGQELADREQDLLKRASSLFVGRESVLRLLDQYAQSRTESIQVVTGNAGMGKSALLAKWVTEKLGGGARIAYHFFSERNGLTSIRDAYLHLLSQLSDKNPLKEEEIAGANEGKLRDELYNRLKNFAIDDGAETILVLDGLDEAEHPFWPPFPSPGKLRVIVSARSGETSYLEGWTNGMPPIQIEPLAIEDLTDWLAEMGDELAKYSQDERFTQSLWQQTGGFPLYLNYLLEELAGAAKAGQDPFAMLAQRPKGFSAYVRDQLNRLTREEGGLRGEVRKIFALLSVALGAITEADLEALTGLTALDLPALPAKVTRWFDFRSHFDGPVTCAFGHPELAREFAGTMGKQARDMEEELIRHCYRWKEHGSHYALEYLPDHLSRAQRYPELFELARDESFFSLQCRAFTDDVQASLKTVRTALAAAARLDDAARMAEFALLQARRISNLQAETPIDALRSGTLSRAWQLADLREPGRAIMWHLLLAAELQEKGDNESAVATLLRLQKKNLEALSGWYGIAAAGLLLPLASLSHEAIAALSQRLLPRYGQEVNVGAAISRLSHQLLQRGLHDLALEVDRHRTDSLLAWIAMDRASHGDFDGAEEGIKQISGVLRSQTSAELAVHVSKAGDSERGQALLSFAVKAVQAAGNGHVEVALQQARLGLVNEALDLLQGIEEKEMYLARGLRETAFAAHEAGFDPGPLLARLERLARDEADKKPTPLFGEPLKPRLLSELAVAYLTTGNERPARQLGAELLATAKHNRTSLESLITIASAYAELLKSADAERLFAEISEFAQGLSHSAKPLLFGNLAHAQANAGMFESAVRTLTETGKSVSRSPLGRVAVKQAAAGDLTGAVELLDPTKDKEALAEIASNLLATEEWQKARQIFVDILQSGDKFFWSPGKDECLARISVVLARQKRWDDAGAALEAIVDGNAKAEALSELAVKYAAAGKFASALDLAQKISDNHPYFKEKAWGQVALEQARQRKTTSGLGALAKAKDRALPKWRAAVKLLIFLQQKNASDLIEEFQPFQGSLQVAWWSDDKHIKAIKCVALARSGALRAALAGTTSLSGRRVIATFEKITPIAFQQGRAADLIATAKGLNSPLDLTRALTGIGLALFRLSSMAAGEKALLLASSKLHRIKETHERQKALVDLGIAYDLADKLTEAEQAWRRAFVLKTQHRYERGKITVSPLTEDDVCARIAHGLTAAGLPTQAIYWVRMIEDLDKRTRVLEQIAVGFVPGGEFSREVLRVAQGAVLGRSLVLPNLIDILVRIRDLDNVKLLLAPAAETVDGAYEVCGALAELYPEQATSIAAAVRK